MADKEKGLAERAREWFSSTEGQESLKKAIERAKENSEKFKRCRQISWEILNTPFTI